MPTQITFGSAAETASERIVSNVSAPLMSSWIGPPLGSCFDLSLRVRSGLIGFHVAPWSVDLNSTLPPRYTVFQSFGATTIGEVQLKRYFRSFGAMSVTPCRYGRTLSVVPAGRVMRTIDPFCESP